MSELVQIGLNLSNLVKTWLTTHFINYKLNIFDRELIFMAVSFPPHITYFAENWELVLTRLAEFFFLSCILNDFFLIEMPFVKKFQ